MPANAGIQRHHPDFWMTGSVCVFHVNTMTNPLVEKIHGCDIYEGFDPSPYPDDTQGWFSNHPVLEQVITAKRPRIIVEVGVWKGASSIFMAQTMTHNGIAGQIISVDTFLGSIEHLSNEWRGALLRKHGWPHLYNLFLANIVRRNLTGIICPLPQTADIAHAYLSTLNIRPDVVYLDASHDHDSVARNLKSYFALLKPGGVLIGDDFRIEWPEVVWAATEFARNYGLPMQISDGKFVIEKSAA